MFVRTFLGGGVYFEGKKGSRQFTVPKGTDQVFLQYRFGKYREIPTEYRPKKPNRYTTLVLWSIFLSEGISQAGHQVGSKFPFRSFPLGLESNEKMDKKIFWMKHKYLPEGR